MQKIASFYHTSQLAGMNEAQVKGLKERLGLTDAQLLGIHGLTILYLLLS
jgi:hypothetical protein